MSVSKRVTWAVAVVLCLFWGVAMAGTEVGSFTLTASNTHGVLLWEGSGTATSTAVMTNGQLLVGSTGADPAPATLGTGTGISTSVGAGTLTINNTGVTSIVAGNGISRDQGTGAVTVTATFINPTVTAKTANYTVLSADSGTTFVNTGAAGEVDFTLPTAAAGLTFVFYVDAAQIVKLIAPSSTTIQVGGSVSTTAGNVSAATTGYIITVQGISSTKYITLYSKGVWTTA